MQLAGIDRVSHFFEQLVPQGVHYGVHQDHYYGPAWERQEGYNNDNYRRN